MLPNKMPRLLKILLTGTVIILGVTIFGVFVTPYMPANLSLQNNPENSTTQQAIEPAVLTDVKKSLVVMETSYGVRSGLVLNENGLVVTLNSILNNKNVLSGYILGDQISLKNLHGGTNDGFALLRMTKSGIETMPFADETKLKKGQKVFLLTITSTDPDTWTTVEGTISQISDKIIVTDIPGNPAIPSSPLFNELGEFIGICDLDESNRVIVITSDKIKTLMETYN